MLITVSNYQVKLSTCRANCSLYLNGNEGKSVSEVAPCEDLENHKSHLSRKLIEFYIFNINWYGNSGRT